MENQRELTVLLIEDDQFACEEIRNYIDQLDDMHLLGITDDSNKALDMVQYCIPDAIILDLELHEGGGNGLFFLSKLHDLGLEKLPYILITTQNTSNVTLEAARQLGADFIITKYEIDTYMKFGISEASTHTNEGGTGIGLLDTWTFKKKYHVSLIIEELDDNIYSKRLSFLFDGKNRYLIISSRYQQIISYQTRSDLLVINSSQNNATYLALS